MTFDRFRRWFWQRPRPHGETLHGRAVTSLELYYDLVYVAVIIQLAHHLSDHLTARGLAEFSVVFTLVWIAWLNGSMYLEMHGRDDGRTRTVVFIQMGLLAMIAVFMIVYYMAFGVTSVIALAVNVILLVALLSMLQATLTLPGMAAIALTVGMAIDANVLINERIREELRIGNTPQASIHAGYERAFGTIIDSNVTTLIAGFALFMFGSGSVRGFAVVLCLGILTSMFSGVMVSRALVNLLYGGRRVERLAIGNTSWK